MQLQKYNMKYTMYSKWTTQVLYQLTKHNKNWASHAKVLIALQKEE